MSDFLSQFTKENYDREKIKIADANETVKLEEIKKSEKPSEEGVKQVEDRNHDVKTLADDVNIIQKSGESKKEVKIPSSVKHDDREEETEIDPEYKNKQRKKFILIGIAAALLLTSIGVIYYSSSHVKMPDFVNVAKQEVVTWANKNKIQVIYEEAFSLEYDEDIIMAQEVDPDKKVKKGSDMKLTVSKGADPDERVEIPEFSKMKASDIETWVSNNKMKYVQIDYVYSEEIEKDTFMKFEILDKDVSKDKFLRKNKAKITVSKGKETFEKNILVLNFKDKTKEEIETWIKEKEFIHPFVFEEAYDDKVMEGQVLSQSVEPGQKIAKNDTMTFVISKGKAIRVPDYSITELSTFDLVNSGGANVIQKQIYNSGYSYGAFISQSIGAGAILNDDPEAMVVVYYSLGSPYVKDLVGQNEGDLPAYFYEFKGKGADITYSITRENSCEVKGTVIRASKNNEYVGINDHITVVISTGNGKNCDAGE